MQGVRAGAADFVIEPNAMTRIHHRRSRLHDWLCPRLKLKSTLCAYANAPRSQPLNVRGPCKKVECSLKLCSAPRKSRPALYDKAVPSGGTNAQGADAEGPAAGA